MILIWVAPLRSSSRAARRHSDTPSAMRARPAPPSQQAQATTDTERVRGRKSPCPPVWLNARPDGKIRGPRTSPSSTACASPASAPPASRTVVNPRANIPSSTRAACNVTRLTGHSERCAQRLVDRNHVHMRVDQPRHRGAAFEIDHLGGGALDRPVRDLADQPVLDEDVVVFAALRSGAVENRAIGKDGRGHGSTLPQKQLKTDAGNAKPAGKPVAISPPEAERSTTVERGPCPVQTSPMRPGPGDFGWKADLWLFVTPTKRRADCVQPHFCVTAAQAILKNLGWRFCSMAKLVFGLNQSLDGYVDHQEFAPGPALFRHFIEQVRGLTGSVYGRRMYEVMRYWDEDRPEWGAEERDFAAAWRSQPKWVVSRSLKSVGPNATLVEDDLEAVIRGLKARARRGDRSCRTGPGAKPDRPWSY